MRRFGPGFVITSGILPLVFAGSTWAQTYYWNPTAHLVNAGAEAQKAYNWTSDSTGTGTNPKSVLDDDFASATLGGAWTVLDKDAYTDAPNPFVNLAAKPGKLILRASGADIWHDTNQFVAVYRSDIAGDFDVSVKVDSQSNAHGWAKAGIMMRNGFVGADSGGYAMVAVTPSHGYIFQTETPAKAGELDYTASTEATPSFSAPGWLRMVKRGTSVTAYYRTAVGNAWTQIGTTRTLAAALSNSQIGLFASSHRAGTTSTAVFDDFTGGGDIAAAAIDLNMGGGKTATADSNARLMAPLSVRSLKFAGYDGTFDFRSATLTLTGNADFSGAAAVAPGTGTLAFGPGAQTLTPRAGAVFPALSKSGSGTLTLAGSLDAGRLTVGGGTVDFGGRNQAFAGLASTGGALSGLDAADTLSLSGASDFSGLTALPAAGTILVSADSRAIDVTAGAATFPDLVLWPRPLTAAASLAMRGSVLNVGGKLAVRDEKIAAGAGLTGTVDFSAGNPDVTLGDSLARAEAGAPAGASSLTLEMGKGVWTTRGHVSLALGAGRLSADSATLVFVADAPAVQNLTVGSGVLGTVRHTGTGILNLAQSGAPLKAGAFEQLSGTLNMNGSSLDMARDISFANGSAASINGLGGRTLKAGGDITLAGTSTSRFALNPSSVWHAAAGGTLSADWADLKNGDAAASADSGVATSNCDDQGGNVRWKFLKSGPFFIEPPAPVSVVAGQPAVFRVKAGGTRPITYAWRRSGDTTVLSRADTLLIDVTTIAQNGNKYYCTAANGVDSVVSLEARLTVNEPPTLLSQPADSAVLLGAPVSFSVAARGSGTLAYAWYRGSDTVDAWATTPTFSLAAVPDSLDGALFSCRVSSQYGRVVSRAARLTLLRPPAITRQPKSVTVTVDRPATFTIGVSGSAPLALSWTRVGDSTRLSQDTVLTIDSAAIGDDGARFVCKVSNPWGGPLVSDTVRLTVVRAATIVREPVDITTTPNRKVVFSVGVIGAPPLVYAWRKQGDTTVIARDTLLQLDSVKLDRDGDVFVFTVSNAYGSDTSREAKLSVVVCDSVFSVSADTLAVDEGQMAKVWGVSKCSSSRLWEVVSGPGPLILDPEIDTLGFEAPRVSRDTAIVLAYRARYADGWVAKNVVVKVKEAIPDPAFTLPDSGRWTGTATYVVKPDLLNRSALDAANYHPALAYRWSLSLAAADTLQKGDSLVLSRPTQRGILKVTLCMDNGGAQACRTHAVDVDLSTVSLAARALRLGPAAVAGRTLTWYADGSARIWDFRGRILWRSRGFAGRTEILPENVARDLRSGRARLEISR